MLQHSRRPFNSRQHTRKLQVPPSTFLSVHITLLSFLVSSLKHLSSCYVRMYWTHLPCSTPVLSFCHFRLAVVCSRAPEHPYIYRFQGRHTLMLCEVSMSLPQPMVSLSVPWHHRPHPDTSEEDGEKFRRFWWDKSDILNAPYEPAKLFCHLHLSNSALMYHMARLSVSPPNWPSQAQYSGCFSHLSLLSSL